MIGALCGNIAGRVRDGGDGMSPFGSGDLLKVCRLDQHEALCQQFLFHDAHWQHVESRNQLHFVVVCQRDIFPIDRQYHVLIEEGSGHMTAVRPNCGQENIGTSSRTAAPPAQSAAPKARTGVATGSLSEQYERSLQSEWSILSKTTKTQLITANWAMKVEQDVRLRRTAGRIGRGTAPG